MLPIHVHFISFWNLLVPSPYCSFIAILSSLYHILIIVFSAPCSLAYMFFSSYTRAKSQSYRHIMVGFLPHSDTLHTFTTYYHSALFMNNNKTITIILPQKIWNNIHHDTIYIYIIMWELKQCSGNFPIGEMSPLGAPRELQVLRSQGLHWSLEQRENPRKKPELP